MVFRWNLLSFLVNACEASLILPPPDVLALAVKIGVPVNPNNAYWKPQRSCVCTEAEISTMAGYANGQGMLFFVVSGHNQ